MLREFVFLRKYKDHFVYAEVKCGSKKMRYDLGSNRIVFHTADIDKLPKLTEKFGWDTSKEGPIEAIALSIGRHINSNISLLMFRMMLETVKDETTGFQIGKLCSYRGKSEYSALVKYFSEPIVRQAPGTDPKFAFDYVDVDASISILLSYENQVRVAKYYQKQIIQDALNTIKGFSGFRKYDVPIKYLKLDRMSISKAGVVHMIFSVKGLPKV